MQDPRSRLRELQIETSSYIIVIVRDIDCNAIVLLQKLIKFFQSATAVAPELS
jgi:hypothetical protein